MKNSTMTAAILLMAAGTAIAQPALDGKIDAGDTAFYGAAKWLQTNPTGFGDHNSGSQPPCAGFGAGIRIAINNSNTLGVVGGTGASSGAGVTTGVEIAIPLSQLGNPAGPIRIAGFINGGGHDFLSNQVIGSLPADTGNLGEPRLVDFSLIDGDQFVEVPAALPACTTSIVFDGELDGAYGAALWTQSIATNFGDSNLGQVDYANGSEIDALHGYICDSDIGNGLEPVLFLFIAGNVESNFNKLDLFLDVGAGGQNQLRGDNPNVDFNGLNRMGNDGVNPGLKFDAAFDSDFYLTMSCGGDQFATFANFAQTLTDGGGQGQYICSGGSGTSFLQAQACPPTLPDAGLAYGSELNAVYSYLDEPNNKLYVHITGNLKSSDEQHRLHLLFDVIAGEGQNAMRGDNVRVGLAEGGQGVINRLGNNGIDPGLTFDADFAADYIMVFHYEEANGARGVVDAAVVRTNGRLGVGGGNAFSLDYGTFQGKASGTLLTLDGSNFCCVGLDPGEIQRNGIRLQDDFTADIYSAFAPRESGMVLDAFRTVFGGFGTLQDWDNWLADPQTAPRDGMMQAVMSNRNLVGVTDVDAAGAAGATEGIEIIIDLDELGWDGASDIKVAGFIGNGETTFLSNQVLGGLPDGAGNLGEPRLVNFDAIAGTQYVVLASVGGGFCDADWCQDGEKSVSDIFCFLADWFANDPDARTYGGASTPVQAIFAWLAVWFATPNGPCVP
jgi:hypothetical protein